MRCRAHLVQQRLELIRLVDVLADLLEGVEKRVEVFAAGERLDDGAELLHGLVRLVVGVHVGALDGLLGGRLGDLAVLLDEVHNRRHGVALQRSVGTWPTRRT